MLEVGQEAVTCRYRSRAQVVGMVVLDSLVHPRVPRHLSSRGCRAETLDWFDKQRCLIVVVTPLAVLLCLDDRAHANCQQVLLSSPCDSMIMVITIATGGTISVASWLLSESLAHGFLPDASIILTRSLQFQFQRLLDCSQQKKQRVHDAAIN